MSKPWDVPEADGGAEELHQQRLQHAACLWDQEAK